MTTPSAIKRRNLLKTIACSILGMAGASPVAGIVAGKAGQCPTPPKAEFHPAQTRWEPEPRQVAVAEHMIPVNGANLWSWDTGGDGTPIILLHAHTGSAATWAYQQPVLAGAGYRVIAFSRRGHFRSEVLASNNVAAANDLDGVVDYYGLERFHLVGTAAGGFVALDYALSFSVKLLSLTVASSLGGIDDPEFKAVTDRILTPPFLALPSDIKELGPAYRVANPAGHHRWQELEHSARPGNANPFNKRNTVGWNLLEGLSVPTLLMTGDADLYSPPPLHALIASHMPNSQRVTIAEAGHSAYWEQPIAFNKALLAFLKSVRLR